MGNDNGNGYTACLQGMSTCRWVGRIDCFQIVCRSSSSSSTKELVYHMLCSFRVVKLT
jgi:hypothetical protein